MEKRKEQPETAYETSKLIEYLLDLSDSERRVLRTDATDKFEELGAFIEALDKADEIATQETLF